MITRTVVSVDIYYENVVFADTKDTKMGNKTHKYIYRFSTAMYYSMVDFFHAVKI
jgi:hypothetical protein